MARKCRLGAALVCLLVVGGSVGSWLTSPEERFANRLGRFARGVIFVASSRQAKPRRIASSTAAAILIWIAIVSSRAAIITARQPPVPPEQPPTWQYGASIDVGALVDNNSPDNHLFRNRGTTPRVDELDVNMAAA